MGEFPEVERGVEDVRCWEFIECFVRLELVPVLLRRSVSSNVECNRWSLL